MDREKYLNELESYLSLLKPEERADAIIFYSEYIEDAGLTTREQIEEKLGTPRQLSRKILADHSIKMSQDEVNEQKIATPRSNIKMIWLILLALLASPFVLGAGGLLVGFLILILFAIVGVIFVLGVLFCAGVVVMGSLIYTGIALLFTSWATGIFYLGLGLLALGVLLVILPIFYWMMKVILQGIGNFSRYLYNEFSKRRKQKGGI